jgi:hypothetical protein
MAPMAWLSDVDPIAWKLVASIYPRPKKPGLPTIDRLPAMKKGTAVLRPHP